MITYKKFSVHRLGNSLFMYAFIRAASIRNKCSWVLPKWKYSEYFQADFGWHEDLGITPDVLFQEGNFDFNEDLLTIQPSDISKNICYQGYFQSEKYFSDVWDKFKDDLRWNPSFLNTLIDRSGFAPGDNDVSVHIRRGDYVANKNYVNLSPEYYLSYFVEHPELTFYIFSDDYAYCKLHFQSLSNVDFVEGCDEIQHLCFMSQFRNHFIANSSFSWWGAKLAELYHEKVFVVYPDGLFRGDMAKSCTAQDFYPQQWNKRGLDQRIDLSDVTFIIPVSYDSKDRRQNLELTVCYLQRQFKTNIVVGEQGKSQQFEFMSQWVGYTYFGLVDFHRTRMINEMVKASTTPIVINWDADVFVPPAQIYTAVKMIRDGAHFVYPYIKFARVPRHPFHKYLIKALDVGILSGYHFKGMEENTRISYGGAVVMDKKAFVEAGLENEYFKNWGREDLCRVRRFRKLGYSVKRTEGTLYHLDHFVGVNSFKNHPHYTRNEQEYVKVRDMSVDELREYINTWPWTKT